MTVEFAKKLRIAARALGCATQKELCARFLACNPETQFRLANSYKWSQGHPQPRSGAVFDDWARVLDLDRPAQFLAECSLAEFIALVSTRYHLPDSELGLYLGATTPFDLADLLQGNYALYSLAWSKAARPVDSRLALHRGQGERQSPGAL